MSEFKNNNDNDDNISLSFNSNYNGILTEEDLKTIKDQNLKKQLLVIQEEIQWLKNYKFIEQKFKIIFEVIYSIFHENKREIYISMVSSDLNSYLERLNYLINKMIYNQTFSNFKIIKIKNDIENYRDILKDMIELDWDKKRCEKFSNEKLMELTEMVNRTFENLQSLLKFSVDGKEKKDVHYIKINLGQQEEEDEEEREMDRELVEKIKNELAKEKVNNYLNDMKNIGITYNEALKYLQELGGNK